MDVCEIKQTLNSHHEAKHDLINILVDITVIIVFISLCYKQLCYSGNDCFDDIDILSLIFKILCNIIIPYRR